MSSFTEASTMAGNETDPVAQTVNEIVRKLYGTKLESYMLNSVQVCSTVFSPKY